MIKEGRPYSIENGTTDDALITSKHIAVTQVVGKWIKNNIEHADHVLEGRTSYGIKHLLQHDTGIYLTNNEFKDAMLLAGFEPVDPDALYWEYRIFLTRDRIWSINPFFNWVKAYYRNDDTPEGDFVRDMAGDKNFPSFASDKIILEYLDMIMACPEAKAAFKNLWREYKKTKTGGQPSPIAEATPVSIGDSLFFACYDDNFPEESMVSEYDVIDVSAKGMIQIDIGEWIDLNSEECLFYRTREEAVERILELGGKVRE